MFVVRKTYPIGLYASRGFVVPAAAGGDFVTDTFTQASDITLASHTGEVGATWTVHPSYSGTALDDATLDRIYLNSAAAGGYYASGSPPGADYYVEADFYRLSLLSNNAAIVLGFDTAADTGILLRLNDTGASQQYEVIDRVTGSNTILNGGTAISTSHIPSVGGAAVKVRIVRTGTAITVFFDGVQDTSLNSTTSITAVGKAGIRASGTASATTGIHLDNFSAR